MPSPPSSLERVRTSSVPTPPLSANNNSSKSHSSLLSLWLPAMMQPSKPRRVVVVGGLSSPSSSSSRKPLRSSVTVIGGVLTILLLVYFITLFAITAMSHHHHASTAVHQHQNRLAFHKPLRKPKQPQQHQQRRHKKNKKNKDKTKEKPKRRRPSFRAEEYGKDVNPHTIKPMNATASIDILTTSTSNNSSDHQKPPVPPSQMLKAFLEPLDTAAWNTKPLAVRTTAQASQLKEMSYPQLNSCRKLPEQWPTDDFPDADPFLPWIHDVFPTHDGKYIQFVAQNKRRCRTGTTEDEIQILEHMQPQVALFQHVPVKRITTTTTASGQHEPDNSSSSSDTRYRLSSHEEADVDGMATRFICRFKPSMKETLSVFNVDYDFAAFRKGHRQTFSEEGYDNKSIHTSQLIFQCPVPPELVDMIRDGSSVQNDWATLFVDVIPIRTPPRFGPPNQFFPPWYRDLQIKASHPLQFDPSIEWGDDHVLPRIEDAGRWENIPICQPSLMTYEPQTLQQQPQVAAVGLQQQQRALLQQGKTLTSNENNKHGKNIDITTGHAEGKKHGLVACVWASAGYTTRGHRFAVNDGQRRLLEWIHFNQLVGFDHFYIYDNSGAFSSDVSLQPITDMFPDLVTRIVWPAKVCNNNPNNVDSVGERSSQYAAEASCRLRFGPHVEWMASFDLDEYIVPVGEYQSLLPLLDKLHEEGKKIISFGSWRAWPRRDLIDKPVPISDSSKCWSVDTCFDLTVPLNHTILQTYNCDRVKGKKKQTMPAEKQIYRPDYVKQHFIHYSTITELTLWNTTEWANKTNGRPWRQQLAADLHSRFSDEETEATMLHTKAVARQDTAGYEYVCQKDYTGGQYCRLGNPWPPGAEEANITADSNGWNYNCYVNEKIENYWVPKLEQALQLDNHAAFQ